MKHWPFFQQLPDSLNTTSCSQVSVVGALYILARDVYKLQTRTLRNKTQRHQRNKNFSVLWPVANLLSWSMTLTLVKQTFTFKGHDLDRKKESSLWSTDTFNDLIIRVSENSWIMSSLIYERSDWIKTEIHNILIKTSPA